VYVIQDDKIQEYKVLSRGTLYSEKLQEIFFENTNTKIKYNYIPIYEQSEITISYSSIKLTNKIDILKLKKQIINPKEPDNKSSFYFEDSNSINKTILTKDDLKLQKEYKVNEEDKNKRLNILCIIEDILAQIEDMYERYYTNYKLAYAYNDNIIEDIKKQNSYAYTIANLVDTFYIDEKQEKDAKELKDTYQELITILLSDKICSSILTSSNNLANILDEKTFDIAKSYIKDVAYLNNECLKDIVKYYVDKHSFVTKDNYKYLNPNATYKEKELLKKSKNYKQLYFYGDNLEFTKIQEDPRVVVSYLMFAIFFANKYEEKIRKSEKFKIIDSLRKKLYFKIKQMIPYPSISEENTRDIKNVIKKQKNSYFKIIKRDDKLFEEYDSLKIQLTKKSYEFDSSSIKFKSNFLYSNKENFYKNEAKLEIPQNIIKKIEKQLQSEELKKLLKIYEEIKVEDEEAYIISYMNIVCLLSYPRVNFDEEIDKISFFSPKLKHIYTFVENLTDRRILLSDEIKDRITNEYKISDVYLDMILRLIKYAYFSSDNQKANAKNFISKYEEKENRNYFVKLEDINDHLFDEKFQSKNFTEDITKALYTINGFSQKTIDLFEAMKDKDFDRTKIPKDIKDKLNKLTETTNKIKVASAIIAFITLGIYIFRKDKNIQNTMSVIDDILHMTKIVTERMLVNSVNANKSAGTVEKTIQEILKDKKIQSMSKTTLELITKVGVPLVVINGTYSSLKLLSNEDYDASFLSGLKTALTVSLLIASGVTSYVLLILLEIVWNYFSHYIIDSNIEKYLYKSLLYEDIYEHSGFLNIGSLYHINYKAYYLFETTNTNEKLKSINSEGFKTSKNLINFIGENYDENKEYFDTALRNELSFFKSSLFGYKLELLNKTKRVKKLKNKYDIDIVLNQKTFIKISKKIAENKKNKFIFVLDGIYTEIEQNDFFLDNKYYIYDLYNQKFAYLKDLEQINNKKASIIVLSPQVELKYDFIYDYKDLNYLFALNFKQSSFTIKDIEELEKLKEKKD
jgi:hypothetical protein